MTLLGNSKNITSEQVVSFLSDYSEYEHIFTDESKDPVSGKARLGVYVAGGQFQESIRISDNLSVFTAELKAIQCALEWVKQIKPHNSIICSYSAAALMSLKEGTSRARPDLVVECLCCLYDIERAGGQVCFVWVPGHAGVEGNERADILAKESLRKGS